MKITRLCTGTDYESHFEEIHIELEDAGEIGRSKMPQDVVTRTKR